MNASSPRRVLLVATAPPNPGELRQHTRGRADSKETELLVVCPPLNRFLRLWTSNVWPARREAARTLELTMAAVHEAGLRADGRVGDDDSLQALDDAVRAFPADEIVLSTGSDPRRRRLEQQLVRFARRRATIPITHLEAPPAAEPQLLRSSYGVLRRLTRSAGLLARMPRGHV
jgi:hypothetical protein